LGTPEMRRYLSFTGAGAEAAGSAGLGGSLIRSKLKPFAVMAAVKLQRAGAGAHYAAERHNSSTFDSSAAAAALGVNRQASAGDALAAAAAALTPQQQQAARDLMRNLSTVSAPDPATAEAAAQLLELQQAYGSCGAAADGGAAAAAGVAGTGSGAGAGAAAMQESMTFVMLVSVQTHVSRCCVDR
jgi:hypothetical protein